MPRIEITNGYGIKMIIGKQHPDAPPANWLRDPLTGAELVCTPRPRRALGAGAGYPGAMMTEHPAITAKRADLELTGQLVTPRRARRKVVGGGD